MSRFVIREVEGFAILPAAGSGGSSPPGLSVTVLDTAYCNQIVRSWQSESYGGARFQRVARMRREAAQLVASLEAEAGAT